MPKYARKPYIIDAFQWHAEPIMALEDYPDWAQAAIKASTMYFINPGTENSGVKVILKSGRIASAYDGDWIARAPYGDIFVSENAAFNRGYTLHEDDFA